MRGVGRGAGEPPEAAWSQIGPHGYILQYRALPSRQAALENIIANFNADKLVGLPELLVRSYKRARQAEKEAMSELGELKIIAREKGILPGQVNVLDRPGSEENLIKNLQNKVGVKLP